MGNDGDDLKPIEVKRKPKRQEQLEDYQLNETYTKVITATDPNVSKSITRFNYTGRHIDVCIWVCIFSAGLYYSAC